MKWGKHVSIDEDKPEAIGICDATGFVHLRKDLVKEMEYRGNSLQWTGRLVGKDYVQKPNPQLVPPILPPDPVPVINPRTEQSAGASNPYGVPAAPRTQTISYLNSQNLWSLMSTPLNFPPTTFIAEDN